MATPAQWVAGARPRTLPAAVAPVLAGTGVAAYAHLEVWWKAVLALLVSLLLQVGVNYANDYSDGVRGTDADRVGPMRLVGSGAATPGAVRTAAFLMLGLAGAVGLVLAATTAWWLVAVGAACILAAWFYTGGRKPYGYLGLGEVMVFVFFGLVAVLGTVFVQVHQRSHDVGWFAYRPLADAVPPNCVRTAHGGGAYGSTLTICAERSVWLPGLSAAIGIGALACAILVANNLRDIPTDRESGKRTLAVALGADRTRLLYGVLVLLAVAALAGVALTTDRAALLGLVAVLPLARGVRTVTDGATGPDLVPVLQQTGLGELVYALGIFVGLLVAR
ncbi:MAG: 1,4-dihydroxy-2-naphthoate polyprenyltransferase [Marmoricola sp.]